MTDAAMPKPRDRRPGYGNVRLGTASLRLNIRVLTVSVIGLIALGAIGIWAMTLGVRPLSPADVFWATLGQGTEEHRFVVLDLRMPRVAVAILVGIALALSGAIFQGLVRNELVSPDIIGINSGAAGIGFVWLLMTRNLEFLPVALFSGAMITAAIIYALSWKSGISPNRLVLVGIGIQTMLAGFETFFVRRFSIEDVIWADDMLLGSVASAEWADASLLALGLAILVPLTLLLAWPLRIMQLGDDSARALGIPLEPTRLALIFCACWLSAIAISVAGLVGFVALMVPHAARMIAGPLSGSVLVLTGILGALLVLCGDVVAHHFMPVPLPLSIVLGAVGAPYFLFLFWRSEVRL